MPDDPKLTELEQLKLNNLRLDRALQQQRLVCAREMNLAAQLYLEKLEEAEYKLMDEARARAAAPLELVSGADVASIPKTGAFPG
jgi:hypothetical protein